MSRDAKKVALIVQKGKGLNEQLNKLTNGLEQVEIDYVNAKLRLERITVLFHAYEEHHDELAILDADNVQIQEIDSLRDKYYQVASRIQTMQVANAENNITAPIGNSTFMERQRLLKLPAAEIPKFDGNHDKWLSFKNTFKSMVDSRTDIDNVIKFTYLRNALQGEALNKLSIYDLSAEHYENAWKLLTDSYDRKRVLVSKHLDAILNISTIDNATSTNLSKLIDDMRQHMSMLQSLQVEPDERVIIRILERALPVHIHRKWEESLSLDELPELNKFYQFINETIFRLRTFERD
ncbi:uncharacterized protein [Neodiprion pinetum]|uniref:uncharacterized protein n=1 Tax=Neodiprion pinetum TaxID=441929 RepID=UPI001EDDCFC6|nr:uncharacterized protein LOC124224745 [Neodiprion pinetum]